MFPPHPRDRVPQEPLAAPCVATGDGRPQQSAAPPSLLTGWSAFGPRPKPRPSRLHPASVRERRPDSSAGAPRHVVSSSPSHPSPPNRPCRRCRRRDQLPGPALRRLHRTTLPSGSGPAKSEQAPIRSGRRELQELALPVTTEVTIETQTSGARTPSTRCCHRAAAQHARRPWTRNPPRGRTRSASPETDVDVATRDRAPLERDGVATTPRSQDAADPKTRGDRAPHCLREPYAPTLPRLSAVLSRCRNTPAEPRPAVPTTEAADGTELNATAPPRCFHQDNTRALVA
jgi:hypothetical protein